MYQLITKTCIPIISAQLPIALTSSPHPPEWMIWYRNESIQAADPHSITVVKDRKRGSAALFKHIICLYGFPVGDIPNLMVFLRGHILPCEASGYV